MATLPPITTQRYTTSVPSKVVYATAVDNASFLAQGAPITEGSIVIDNTTTPPTILGIADGSGNFTGNVGYNSTTGALSAGGVTILPAFGGTYTWATKPVASAYPVGTEILITDIGNGHNRFFTNGTYWQAVGQITLAQSGMSFGIPPSGTVAANGALTLGGAISLTYPKAWMYFPAGAVYSGSLAGFYYVQMSSGTAGTIYNNYAANGTVIPTIPPTTPTPIVAAGPGAYTAVTTAFNLFWMSLPANILGPNGAIEIDAGFAIPSTAGTKQIIMGLNNIQIYGQNFTTGVGQIGLSVKLANQGVTNSQETLNGNNGFPGPTGNQFTITTIDTTASVPLNILGNIGTATDYVFMDHLQVRLNPF